MSEELFCSKCGSRLITTYYKTGKYNAQTGLPEEHRRITCPNYQIVHHWFWGDEGNGHTHDRIDEFEYRD